MDLSLDDIIKTKRVGGATKKPFVKKPLPVRKTTVFKKAQPIADARIRIIQKNRAKIVDARDRLVELTRDFGDVRLKLDKKRAAALLKQSNYGNGYVRTGNEVKTRRVPQRPKLPPRRELYYVRPRAQDLPPRSSNRLPDLVDVPRGYVDYDNMERMEEEEYAVATHLSRTVKNDMAPYGSSVRAEQMIPPAPRRMNSWGSSSEHFDPFDVYEVPHSRSDVHMSPVLPPPPPKGILRPSARQHSPSELYERRYIPQSSSHLSYEMRSRLERKPDPHASMGIFANPLKSPPHQGSASGYRIVVSNLHTSVTQSDIRELFEDIGELYDSRIVRPGIAEVIYKSHADAEKAVDTYHNRQLDGQPMKCMLVNPRSSNKPTAPAMNANSSNTRHVTGKTPLEIDIDALHKVLFRRH